MDNPRIGTYAEDGSVSKWPDTTISGRDYKRPPMTRRIGPNAFVVLDAFPIPGVNADSIIAGLKGTLEAPTEPVAEAATPVVLPSRLGRNSSAVSAEGGE